jgi:hypothetical protein
LIFLLGSEIGFAIGAYLGQNYLKWNIKIFIIKTIKRA